MIQMSVNHILPSQKINSLYEYELAMEIYYYFISHTIYTKLHNTHPQYILRIRNRIMFHKIDILFYIMSAVSRFS